MVDEIISRKEACARGLRFYFTGKPCVAGHLAQRYTSCNRCCACAERDQAKFKSDAPRQWTDKVPDKPISREDAYEQDLTYFFTGEPCELGHVALRYVSSTHCLTCSKIRYLAKRPADTWTRITGPRRKAKAAGETRYNTGIPCLRGHYADRNTASGQCVECAREQREARETNELKAKRKKYRKANAERYRTHVRNRRAQLGTGTHTHEDITAIHEAQRGRCAYCRKKLKGKWHVDHIVPRLKGGTNDRRNLQLTCQRCNNRKCSKDALEFTRELGLLL